MFGRLQVLPLRMMFSTYSGEGSSQGLSTAGEYLLFPTSFPVAPYYLYSARINRHLYDYLQKHKIRYVAAFPIRPGVYPRQFHPLGLDDLESQMGLRDVQWPERSSRSDSMVIDHNNLAYQTPTSPILSEPSVKLVPSLRQLYPIGSVCSLSVQSDGRILTMYLRADIRLQAEWASPHEGPISLVGGRTIKVEPLAQISKEYEQLLGIYDRIKAISVVNLLAIDTKTDKPAVVKVLELMTGYLCTLSFFSPDRLYTIFKTTSLKERLPLLLAAYKQYLEVLEDKWKQLSSQAAVQTRQKEAVYAVYEQMKRLVGNPGQQNFVDKVRQKLKDRNYPQNVAKLIEAELVSIETEGSHDISRKKHYVTLLSEYPFGIHAEETYDIAMARKLLEQEHYGMQKLKKRILEFIAVSKLKGQFRSKVLLLYGPPGVGKTSIVKSIAKCLNRPYARVSLGGQYDTAIVKGHRRTYIGAYPGKIWDSIYRSKVENPVILLDEIDKIVTRAGGSSLQDAVMEVLDPVQNHRFKDDFMDIEIDLSRVLFICTANSLDTIFPPLLDRLERIEVAGYTTHQKEQIFKRYIESQAKQENGLTGPLAQQIKFTPEAVRALIESYCKQAGVRNLVRRTNRIFMKMAFKLVKGLPFDKSVLPNHLREYLGLPLFHQARLFQQRPPAGVMIGLAYNNYGGSIMYIESVNQGRRRDIQEKSGELKEDSKQGTLLVTGNIHQVMKESVQLAYTYAKFVCSSFFGSHYLQQNDVHINFPEIQIGKDGPSAGIAITTSLISLALGKPMTTQIAMTGEITLSGRVNPIGGVKEKTMGAKREGIRALIFPEQNRKDVEELQAQIKEGMVFHFASHYFEVMELVLGLHIENELKALAS